MSYQIKRPQIRFDVALLTELNKEYDSKRLVPKPASAARAAFIERGQVNAERIGKMFPVKGRRVLEIGCGEGDVAEYLARNFNCDVHAIDLQPHEIWKEHKHATFKPLDLSDADEATTKPEELLGTFDFIYSYYAWEHVLHPFGMLQRSQRLLRPGGKFYLSTNLFRGPRASHLYRDLHFPWPHLLFSEDVIYDYYVSQGLPPRYPSWVNRLSIADYLNYFPLAGFRLESISYSLAPIDEELYKRFEHWLARYPRFDLERDHLHAILTPAESGPLQPGVGSQTSGSPQPAARAADSRVSSAFSPGVAAAAPANTAKSSIPNDRLVALTVDVEAQAVRATGDPIDQLIFGRFDGKDYGISRMMELADAAGHKLTLYLDFCEFWQYGEAILDVAREVTRRGHDLQIHAHADLLPRSFWTDQRMSVPPALDRFPADAANVIVSATCELAVRATGRQPQAFRGGAFRFNPALLSALSKNGIQVSSNYYSGAKYWPSRRPHARPFRWENGVLELPVTTADVDGVFRYAIFENLGVDSRPTLEAFLSAARAVPGSDRKSVV